jgi:hypothetical protein
LPASHVEVLETGLDWEDFQVGNHGLHMADTASVALHATGSNSNCQSICIPASCSWLCLVLCAAHGVLPAGAVQLALLSMCSLEHPVCNECWHIMFCSAVLPCLLIMRRAWCLLVLLVLPAVGCDAATCAWKGVCAEAHPLHALLQASRGRSSGGSCSSCCCCCRQGMNCFNHMSLLSPHRQCNC